MQPTAIIKKGFTNIRVRGKTIQVPSVFINDRPVVVTGSWLKLAAVKDEDLVDGRTFENPSDFIEGLKSADLGADIFTFSQKIPETEPKYTYYHEWDNYATIPITTHKEWLEKRVEYDVRKAIKRATKNGVVVKSVPFDDVLVRGIVDIYAESPTRQGKAFWHFQKDFDTVKEEAGTYPEMCEFIGAYLGDELIGFIKMAHIGEITSTIHVIAKKQHFDKKATNAMLAKAVEICEARGSTHLTYGNYIYHDPASSLTEFKRRNGFEQFNVPRYFVPLTLKGRIALALRMHHGIRGMIPPKLCTMLGRVRSYFHTRSKPAAPAPAQGQPDAATEKPKEA